LIVIFDYLIIGGGSAGCVLANRLSEDPQVTVGLIEAGPSDTSVLIHCPAGLALLAKNGKSNWSYQTVPQTALNGRRGFQPRGKVLGGSSSVNAMIYIRGHPFDYDHWASLGNAGWSWNEVLPYFKRSENNERGADEYHGAGGPLNVKDLTSPNRFGKIFWEAAMQVGHKYNADFNGADQEGVGPYQVTHKNGERFSAAKAYLTPILSRTNLTVITEALTQRILFEGKRAIGVEYLRGGQKVIATAKREVLLTAGAFGSPQLLKLSGVGRASELKQHGIAVVHDLPGVGENLQDHADAILVYESAARDLLGISLPGAINTMKGIFEWRNQRTGMLTTNFAEAGGFIKSSIAEAIPDLQFHFVIGKLINHGRKTILGHGFSCHVCVLRPKSRGTVKLASANASDSPLIDPGFLTHPDDMELLVKGVKLMRKIMEAPALSEHRGRELEMSANAKSDDEIKTFIRQTSDTIYHPVGSCKMGTDSMAVVDPELRVHGLQALRVIDASVMPTLIGGNTNAPTIMIAEKAADLIRGHGKTLEPFLAQAMPNLVEA
jgi:choline dehydrogenase-like flavoprotein